MQDKLLTSEISHDVFEGIPFIQGTSGPSHGWGGGILKLDLLKVVSDSISLTIFFEVNMFVHFISFFVLVYSLRLYLINEMLRQQHSVF